MKKVLAGILVIWFTLSLCACKKTESIPTGNHSPTSSQADIHATESSATTATDAVATETTTEITTEDTATAHTHSFSEGKCAGCGMADPDYQQTASVWIPTNGGKKYHKSASCSNMKNPEEVTKSEAESRGFEPCKRCY